MFNTAELKISNKSRSVRVITEKQKIQLENDTPDKNSTERSKEKIKLGVVKLKAVNKRVFTDAGFCIRPAKFSVS